MKQAQYQELLAKCSHVDSLPEMPDAAYRLSQELDMPDPNVIAVERLIHSDPSLTASVLRAACSSLYALTPGSITTVRSAINVLGFRTIYSIAISAWVQAAFTKVNRNSGFDLKRFQTHSAFVGFLSKYFLSCSQRQPGEKSSVTPDELFAAGVLHDVSIALVAFADAKLSAELHSSAKEAGWAVSDEFQRQFGHQIESLGLAACQAWDLPLAIRSTLGHLSHDPGYDLDRKAAASVDLANAVAELYGHELHAWPTTTVFDPDLWEIVGVEEGEIAEIVELISRHVNEFAQAA